MSPKVKIEEPEAHLLSECETFDPDDFTYPDPEEEPADLDTFYGPMRNYIKMVARGYSNLMMLDAAGGLGKTYNVRQVLGDELKRHEWTHLRGFTTPVELYKTLWKAREHGHVLFLDDMSGITSNQKAIDMLKAATDTEGHENWVEYRSSQDIEHPIRSDKSLPQTFNFNGRIVMSFNETPDKPHFNALKDRGTFYNFRLSYYERLELIREIAKLGHFSDLTVREQQETAEWVATVTDPSVEVSIRTFEEVCNMRNYGQQQDKNWERMALEVFDLDYQRYLIMRLRESDLDANEEVEYWKEETGYGQTKYYDTLSEIKSERMD